MPEEYSPQAVSADLSKDSHSKNTDESASRTMRLPESTIVPPLLVGRFGRNLRHHLLHLKLNHGVVLISLAVVGGKHLDSLIVLILSHEPTGRLGQEKDANNNDTRGDHLAPNGNAPGRVSVDVAASVNDPTGDDAANVPGTVVQTRQGTSPLGMSHLTDIAGRRDTAEADAKAQDEASTEELATA